MTSFIIGRLDGRNAPCLPPHALAMWCALRPAGPVSWGIPRLCPDMIPRFPEREGGEVPRGVSQPVGSARRCCGAWRASSIRGTHLTVSLCLRLLSFTGHFQRRHQTEPLPCVSAPLLLERAAVRPHPLRAVLPRRV